MGERSWASFCGKFCINAKKACTCELSCQAILDWLREDWTSGNKSVQKRQTLRRRQEAYKAKLEIELAENRIQSRKLVGRSFYDETEQDEDDGGIVSDDEEADQIAERP